MAFQISQTLAIIFSCFGSLDGNICPSPPSSSDCSYQLYYGRWVCHSNELKANYNGAQSQCESYGGKLATINNKWDFLSVKQIHLDHGWSKNHNVGLEPVSLTVACVGEQCANQVMSYENVILESVDHFLQGNISIEVGSGCARIKKSGYIQGVLATKCPIEERLFLCMSECYARCDEKPPVASDHMTSNYDQNEAPIEGAMVR